MREIVTENTTADHTQRRNSPKTVRVEYDRYITLTPNLRRFEKIISPPEATYNTSLLRIPFSNQLLLSPFLQRSRAAAGAAYLAALPSKLAPMPLAWSSVLYAFAPNLL